MSGAMCTEKTFAYLARFMCQHKKRFRSRNVHKVLPLVLNDYTKALHGAGRIDDVLMLIKVYLNKVGLRN